MSPTTVNTELQEDLTGVIGVPRTIVQASIEDGRRSEDLAEDKIEANKRDVQLSDFTGEHGFYQLSLSLLLFVRYVLLGLMANSGPLMTPDVTFYCHLPMQEILYIMPNISTLSPREQELEIKEEFKQVCQIDLHLYQNQSQLVSNSSKLLPGQTFKTSPIKPPLAQHQKSSNYSAAAFVPDLDAIAPSQQHAANATTSEGQIGLKSSQQQVAAPSRIRECTEFTYQLAPSQGRTVTSEFNLVCDDDWLRSLFQSLLSAAIVVAHVFWGTFSDKYGRFQAQRICLLISLFAGTLSIFAWDFWSFTLMRALCSFGDLGLVVSMTTTMVELVGNNYRGFSVALVNFGYALGVSLLPYLVAYCQDFRLLLGFTVLCHMVTMPFVLATNESIRWLLTNRKHELARCELKRIMRWNQNYREIWPGSCWRALRWCPSFLKGCCTRRQAAETRARRVSLLEQKQQFELKFEEFIKQLECQNLCDPNTDQVEQVSCPAHPRRPSVVRQQQQHQQRPPPPASRFESLLRPELPFGEPRKAEASTTCADEELGSEVKPRLLNMVDLEHLQLIREVEIVAAQQTLEAPARSHSVSSDDSAIKSMSSENNDPLQTGDGRRSSHNDRAEAQWAANRSLREHNRQQQCQPDCINMFAHQLSFVGRVSRLFKDKKLMVATFTIVWTTFNSELLYTSFIIINLYAGEDVYLNYMIGGCAEALAAIVASLLLSYSPRRLSLIAFWLLISFSCFGLSLAHIDNIWAVWLLALAKFSQSCLSSIASVAAYESFPTFLRQSGSGLVFTLGMMGSVFAPLIFAEFDDHAGMDRVLIIFSISSLTAALLIYMFLKETRNCELM